MKRRRLGPAGTLGGCSGCKELLGSGGGGAGRVQGWGHRIDEAVVANGGSRRAGGAGAAVKGAV